MVFKAMRQKEHQGSNQTGNWGVARKVGGEPKESMGFLGAGRSKLGFSHDEFALLTSPFFEACCG